MRRDKVKTEELERLIKQLLTSVTPHEVDSALRFSYEEAPTRSEVSTRPVQASSISFERGDDGNARTIPAIPSPVVNRELSAVLGTPRMSRASEDVFSVFGFGSQAPSRAASLNTATRSASEAS